MAQLELKNICKGFDHPVIDNLSLELEKGDCRKTARVSEMPRKVAIINIFI